jgi:hypothetical protein
MSEGFGVSQSLKHFGHVPVPRNPIFAAFCLDRPFAFFSNIGVRPLFIFCITETLVLLHYQLF